MITSPPGFAISHRSLAPGKTEINRGGVSRRNRPGFEIINFIETEYQFRRRGATIFVKRDQPFLNIKLEIMRIATRLRGRKNLAGVEKI